MGIPVHAHQCRACRGPAGHVVLDLGSQPACDYFPPCDDPGPDPVYPLQMWLCSGCGLAQLLDDPTVPEEPRGTEPAALVAQAVDAVHRVDRLRDQRGRFGSPGLFRHGRVVEQLGEAAAGAEPHLERVNRVRSRIVAWREVIAGGLTAQVEHHVPGRAAAGPALVSVHRYPHAGHPSRRWFAGWYQRDAFQIVLIRSSVEYQLVPISHQPDPLGGHVVWTCVPSVRCGPYAVIRRSRDVSALRELSPRGERRRA